MIRHDTKKWIKHLHARLSHCKQLLTRRRQCWCGRQGGNIAIYVRFLHKSLESSFRFPTFSATVSCRLFLRLSFTKRMGILVCGTSEWLGLEEENNFANSFHTRVVRAGGKKSIMMWLLLWMYDDYSKRLHQIHKNDENPLSVCGARRNHDADDSIDFSSSLANQQQEEDGEKVIFMESSVTSNAPLWCPSNDVGKVYRHRPQLSLINRIPILDYWIRFFPFLNWWLVPSINFNLRRASKHEENCMETRNWQKRWQRNRKRHFHFNPQLFNGAFRFSSMSSGRLFPYLPIYVFTTINISRSWGRICFLPRLVLSDTITVDVLVNIKVNEVGGMWWRFGDLIIGFTGFESWFCVLWLKGEKVED